MNVATKIAEYYVSHPEYGDSVFLRNVSINLEDYMLP
jgi:hypothetical protein